MRKAPGAERAEKKPLVRWKEAATTDPDQIKKWAKQFPTARFGWVLDEGMVVVDIDDQNAFEATGLNLPLTAMQPTPSGGSHWLYTGVGARQTVKEVPGVDTRVGGLGWVGLYEKDSFSGKVAEAPEWLLAPKETSGPTIPSEEAPLTTRNEILEMIGRWRWSGMDEAEILSGLLARYEDGRITESDPARPWTKADFEFLAKEMGRKPKGAHEPTPEYGKIRAAASANQTIQTDVLFYKDIRPLRFTIPDLLAEGTTLLVAPPKIGKSWLAYQIALEVGLGGSIFGRDVESGAVLYYSLEDGERRAQSRMKKVLGDRRPPKNVTLSWSAPRIGQGLEGQIKEWLEANADARLVVIDTLQHIRPRHAGSRNLYEVDVEDISKLQNIFRDRDVSLLIIHHTRKSRAQDDLLETVSGSYGTTGSVDAILVIVREREETRAQLSVVSRDIEEKTLYLKFDIEDGIWTETGYLPPRGDKQQEVFDYIKENGPVLGADIVRALGISKQGVSKICYKLLDLALIGKEDGKWVALPVGKVK